VIPTIWIWQYLETVTPEDVAGLDPVPEVPFDEVVTRAVSAVVKGKVKRTSEPGVILWEVQRKTPVKFFANLVDKAVVFEKPTSKLAKDIKKAMEPARHLTPSDLEAYTERVVLGLGGVHLMGPLWLVPGGSAAGHLLTGLRSLPGSAVGALPVGSGQSVGEVLALMAGRLAAESGRMVEDADSVQRETNKRRLAVLRQQAEGVARLAGIFRIDMTAIGQILLDAEATIKAKLGITRYEPELDFGGSGQEEIPDVYEALVEPSTEPPSSSAPPPLNGPPVKVERPVAPKPRQPTRRRSMRRAR
jgi:hypothetical protein